MRRRHAPTLAAVVVLLAAVTVAGCGVGPFVRGSGTLVQTTPVIEPFDSLVVSSAFDVTLAIGDETSLLLRSDDNLVDRIRVSTEGEVLALSLDGSVSDATLQADLTVPADAVSSIKLSGAASLTSPDAITSAQLALDLAGASRAFVVVQADGIDVLAQGASVVNASGTATSLTVDAQGASSLRLSELEARSADVTAAGASRVEVSVAEELTAQASEASTVRYAGAPDVVRRVVSGASTVDPA